MTLKALRAEDATGKLKYLPVILAAVIYFSSAGGRAVIDYDEGHYSGAAVEMFKTGDWVTPHVNGIRFLEKPPLMYWLTATSFHIWGVNEFALRLPTALAVTALTWVVMLCARRGAGERAAIISGMGTAFAAGTFLFTRETLHDIWHVLFLTAAMYAFLEWYLGPRHRFGFAMLFYAATAGSVMCRSLVGIAFPAGIIVVFYLLSREWPDWPALHLAPGSALFLLLTVPWHWLAAMRNSGFLRYFFVNEQFLRFLGRHDPPVLWQLPLVTFWVLLLVWFFPWTAFLPAAFTSSRKPEERPRAALVKLSIAWAAVILIFFSVTGRLEHYAFPVLPALSLLVGHVLGGAEENKLITWGFRSLAVVGILVFLGGTVAAIYFVKSGRHPVPPTTERAGMVYETDFSILSETPAAIQRDLVTPAVVTMTMMPLGFLAALRFETLRRRTPAVMCLAAVMLVIFGMVHWSLAICEDMISSRKFGLAVAHEAQPGDHLIVVGDYESANSLNFYQPLRVEIFDGVAYALIPGMKFQDAVRVVLTKDEFASLWNSAGRVFVLMPVSRAKELRPPGREVLRVLDRVLIRNN